VESGLDGITLALIGHGGHGKTGLMAKLAQLAYEREGPKGKPCSHETDDSFSGVI
jgi:ABC-type glutathione transport system ATPase component